MQRHEDERIDDDGDPRALVAAAKLLVQEQPVGDLLRTRLDQHRRVEYEHVEDVELGKRYPHVTKDDGKRDAYGIAGKASQDTKRNAPQ